MIDPLLKALQRRDAEGIWRVLQVLDSQDRLHLIQEYHYLEILRSLRPRKLLEDKAKLMDSQYRKIVFKQFAERVNWVKNTMVRHKVDLGLPHYFRLLEAARGLKSVYLAKRFWSEMIQAQIHPDVYCYNAYMAAVCAQASDFGEFRMRKRQPKNQTSSYMRRHRRHVEQKGGAAEAIMLYREMLERNVKPTSMTFDILLLALGRDGNLPAIRSLLNQTWNIALGPTNMNAVPIEEQGVVDEYEEEGVDVEEPFDPDANTAKFTRDSVLYPTSHTLLAIATAFGVNSQIGLALEAVDRLSKAYDIRIDQKTWTALMKWAYADAAPSGFTLAKVSADILDLARGKPYECVPSLPMYMYAIRSHLARSKTDDALKLLEEMMKAEEEATKKEYAPMVAVCAERVVRRVKKIFDAKVRSYDNKAVVSEGNGDQLAKVRFLEAKLLNEQKMDDIWSYWRARVAVFEARTTATADQPISLPTSHDLYFSEDIHEAMEGIDI